MMAIPRLFFDASVFIAAAGSQTGGSALVLSLCRHGRAKAVSSRLVLLEAERNVRNKLGQDALLHFYHEIASLDLDLVETPSAQEIAEQSQVIDPKDAHVLAAALNGAVQFLLTLDRKHFFSLRATLPFTIMTPGDFLRRIVA